MQIENEFAVTAPADALWTYLLDVERVVPCMPGAELTETVDDTTWKGRMNMKFGPVTLSFVGRVQMTERDDAAQRVVLTVKATEQKGKGAMGAAVTAWLEDGRLPGESLVKMAADINITGSVAQLARGLLPEISRQLTAQFAECLKESFTAQYVGQEGPATASATQEAASAPRAVGGIRLGLSAVWRLIVKVFRRIFGVHG